MHRLVGRLTGDLWAQIRGDGFEAKVARFLGQRIPLPPDQSCLQVARTLRALGILCCVTSGRDLTRCPCLIALAGDLTIEQLKTDLRGLAQDAAWRAAA